MRAKFLMMAVLHRFTKCLLDQIFITFLSLVRRSSKFILFPTNISREHNSEHSDILLWPCNTKRPVFAFPILACLCFKWVVLVGVASWLVCVPPHCPAGTVCCVFRRYTLLSQCLSSLGCINGYQQI